jgi:neutral ceramidase
MKQIFIFLCLILPISLSAQAPEFLVGVNKTDITTYKKGGGMLGYSMSFNVSDTVVTPLHSRSFIIQDKKGNKVAIVETELCFIPAELKTAIVQKVAQTSPEFDEENVMILAQHTHCSPAGYCHFSAYNMSVPGYIPEIFNDLRDKISVSILAANEVLIPANLSLSKGEYPLDWEVGFNRSRKAYNRNKDVEKIKKNELNRGINRETVLLKFTDEENIPIGAINWFGVHATSLSNNYNKINSDNKGYAATYLEEQMESINPAFVGAFAQATSGDVSPKFVYNRKLHWQRGKWEGKFPDDEKSAEYNGQLQFKKALELMNSEAYKVKSSEIQTTLRFYNFSDITVDSRYSYGKGILQTSPSCVGMSMIGGALMDGPAAPKAVVKVANGIIGLIKAWELSTSIFRKKEVRKAIWRKYRVQGKKKILMESGDKKMLGTKNIKRLIIPGFLDPTIATFKKFHRAGALEENTWTPQILPVQFVQIGDIVLAGLPFEITTTAGKRLKKGIQELYANEGVKEVILCSYANSYSGYITTNEEYRVQLYEGGHTVFGQHSLAALQTTFLWLFNERGKQLKELENPLKPPVFSETELNKRLFYERKALKKK